MSARAEAARLIDEIGERVDESRMTTWEVDFVESIEGKLDDPDYEPGGGAIGKLRQILEERS